MAIETFRARVLEVIILVALNASNAAMASGQRKACGIMIESGRPVCRNQMARCAIDAESCLRMVRLRRCFVFGLMASDAGDWRTRIVLGR